MSSTTPTQAPCSSMTAEKRSSSDKLSLSDLKEQISHLNIDPHERQQVVRGDQGPESHAPADHERYTCSSRVTAHFEEIETAILEYLKRADGVKICAAWFTSERLVAQLGMMGEVGLIIGANERLTPGNPEYKAEWVHTLLQELPDMVHVYQVKSEKALMHNKFMILFQEGQPYAVITGSFNYTYKANSNWENIVYIESRELGLSYLNEYNKILKCCVPLVRYLKP